MSNTSPITTRDLSITCRFLSKYLPSILSLKEKCYLSCVWKVKGNMDYCWLFHMRTWLPARMSHTEWNHVRRCKYKVETYQTLPPAYFNASLKKLCHIKNPRQMPTYTGCQESKYNKPELSWANGTYCNSIYRSLKENKNGSSLIQLKIEIKILFCTQILTLRQLKLFVPRVQSLSEFYTNELS